MYAVLKTGGKQYRVEPGQVLRVEKLEAEEGASVRFDQVLMIGGGGETAIGSPLLDGAFVEAEVLAQVKGEKVISFVRRRRKHSSKRTRGHRQRLTNLRITGIQPSGGGGMVHAAAAGATDAEAEAETVAPQASEPEVSEPAGASSAADVATAGEAQAPAAPEAGVADGDMRSGPDEASSEAVEAPIEDQVADEGVPKDERVEVDPPASTGPAPVEPERGEGAAGPADNGAAERPAEEGEATQRPASQDGERDGSGGASPAALATPAGAIAAGTAAVAAATAAVLDAGAAIAGRVADATDRSTEDDETDTDETTAGATGGEAGPEDAPRAGEKE